MKISELSARTGVTVPTIKYYLREGLLPEGELTSPTQASYGEAHERRLRVIRALLDSGVTVAESRRVIAALDDPPPAYDLLGTAHSAITPAVDEPLDLTAAESLAEGLGWKPGMCSAQVLNAVARALDTLESAGFTVPEVVMSVYLDGIRRIADAEIAGVPDTSAEEAVQYVVLGSVLVEPLLLALRRVAQQVASGERHGSGTEACGSD